jgi:hypothetical protein
LRVRVTGAHFGDGCPMGAGGEAPAFRGRVRRPLGLVLVLLRDDLGSAVLVGAAGHWLAGPAGRSKAVARRWAEGEGGQPPPHPSAQGYLRSAPCKCAPSSRPCGTGPESGPALDGTVRPVAGFGLCAGAVRPVTWAARRPWQRGRLLVLLAWLFGRRGNPGITVTRCRVVRVAAVRRAGRRSSTYSGTRFLPGSYSSAGSRGSVVVGSG